MRPVSAAFLAALTSSHQAISLVEILDGGEVSATATATDGSVTLDATAAIRGRVDATFVDDGSLGLVPTTSADALTPYGNELRVSRGIRFPDGTEEFAPLGVFGIQGVIVGDSGDGMTIRVNGLDRAQKVSDAKFEDPYQIAAGNDLVDELQAVIESGVPGLTYDFASVTRTTAALAANEGDDRWALALDMAAALGMLLFFDGAGTATLEVIAQPGGESVFDLVEGDNGVLVAADRGWTREGTFNRVIATGENTGQGAPFRGVATDNNPYSPTYYYGPFGKVPTFYSSPAITSDAQAIDAAEGMLAKQLGTTQTVDFGSIVNPALEPNDIVRITRNQAGIDENHIIDQITIPLDAESSMSGKTRATQVTS